MTGRTDPPTRCQAPCRQSTLSPRRLLSRILTAGVLTLPAFAASETNESPRETLRVVLVMQNGDRIAGESEMRTLPVRNSLGRFQISMAQLLTGTMADDHETISCALANGDLITGIPEAPAVELMGLAGKHSMAFRHIRVIQVEDANVPVLGRRKTADPAGAKLDLLPVPAGTFAMGADEGSDDEKPIRDVAISHGFWMGRYEVTELQWREIMGDGQTTCREDQHPVRNVSWPQCVDFCHKLTARERLAGRLPPGYAYRLPTEAEWEYAARLGSLTAGAARGTNKDLPSVAWYQAPGKDSPQPVGGKRPNDLGLHDMLGNVWEWCHDWYQDSYASLGSKDPHGPSNGVFRVCRGGSWRSDAAFVRSTCRRKYQPSAAESSVGLRIVLAVPLP